MTRPAHPPVAWPTEPGAADPLADVVAAETLLVALDFDGTLSPLVDDPMAARATPEARAALDALVAAPGTRVALVSGRAVRDLRIIAEHGDDSPILLAGSHGTELFVPGEDVADEGDPLVGELARAAEGETAGLDGVFVEVKPFGFAVHTRLADPGVVPALHERVEALVSARAPEWRHRRGRDILEFAARAEGKDAGVAVLRERTGADAVVFAGDDVTDEDALRSLSPGDLGIHVGDGETAAAVRVPDIATLARLLGVIAEERTRTRE